MSKNAYKNDKYQDSQNRVRKVNSGNTDSSYQLSEDENATISEQDIQKRAYEIHEQKGGSDLDNWLEAERVLRKEKRAQ